MRRHLCSIGLILVALAGCSRRNAAPALDLEFADLTAAPQKLSAYGMFAGAPREQKPAPGVVPYDLRTPLFSDYASKFRFVKLPAGQKASYLAGVVMDFPVGTIIAKTFAYPADMRKPGAPMDLVETRILLRQKAGWIGLPYVWNEDESDATLKLAGTMSKASWIDGAGERVDHQYMVPNANQCKGCHRVAVDDFQPIGLKARYLNKDFAYDEGVENQLDHWTRLGLLEGAPPSDQIERVPVWDDPATGTLDERARAYLEINCAHCHSPTGPARTTGLNLNWGPHRDVELGIFKFPVAAGRGSGDRLYGIVPGEPDKSILMFRVTSLDPGVMMPELGRRLIHREGVELLRDWIASMPPREHSSPKSETAPSVGR